MFALIDARGFVLVSACEVTDGVWIIVFDVVSVNRSVIAGSGILTIVVVGVVVVVVVVVVIWHEIYVEFIVIDLLVG